MCNTIFDSGFTAVFKRFLSSYTAIIQRLYSDNTAVSIWQE